MSNPIFIEKRVHFVRGTKGRKQMRSGNHPAIPQRVPRISRLMALAIHFDQLIRSGAVKDQSELARLGQVTVARISQIMGLLFLAPEIQERLLLVDNSNITEKIMRQITQDACWASQIKKVSMDS